MHDLEFLEVLELGIPLRLLYSRIDMIVYLFPRLQMVMIPPEGRT